MITFDTDGACKLWDTVCVSSVRAEEGWPTLPPQRLADFNAGRSYLDPTCRSCWPLWHFAPGLALVCTASCRNSCPSSGQPAVAHAPGGLTACVRSRGLPAPAPECTCRPLSKRVDTACCAAPTPSCISVSTSELFQISGLRSAVRVLDEQPQAMQRSTAAHSL